MSKKIAVAVSLLLTSAVCALVAGFLILLAFKQGDCDGGCNSGELLWSVPAIFTVGLGLGWLLWRRSKGTWRSLATVIVILAVATMLPVLATYAYKLQQKNNSLEQQAALRTNQDYSHMLLAVRDIPAINVMAGERCIFSVIDCEQQPHRIEAICKRPGAVSIAQSDWNGLARLPKEDFPVPVPVEIQRFPLSCTGP
jgi:uncharacterized protein (TIGR03382 family)